VERKEKGRVNTVKVLQEILTWSAERPTWQRDALRRLVVNGELSDDDIRELTEVCKGDHGLIEKVEIKPLAKEHVPDRDGAVAAVSLDSIFHHKGVNALAEDQTLKFAPGLTIVYGDNGAGKTGYIRILKQACRARGQEEILGNVVSGVAPPKPVVNIKYKVGDETTVREWVGGDADEFISRVSVFDTQCAAVYLNERTDVAFLPFGLDLFDKLVKACRAVRSRLESEQRALNTNALAPIVAQISQGQRRRSSSGTSLRLPSRKRFGPSRGYRRKKKRGLLSWKSPCKTCRQTTPTNLLPSSISAPVACARLASISEH
jgi:hypothetical protein